MLVIYRAFDGMEFSTEKECRDYEVSLTNLIKMYTWGGKRTNKVEDAVVIYLNVEDESAAATFIDMCKLDNMSSEGITIGDSGWFYWDEYHSHYTFIDEEVFEIFAKIYDLND